MVTLAQRIGPPGPPPGPDATRLVRRVHELFDVPLDGWWHDPRPSSQATEYPAGSDEPWRSTDVGDDVRAAAGAFPAARSSVQA